MKIKIPLNLKRISHIFLMLLLSCSLFSQITVDIKNQPIKDALKEIENKSSFKFFYNTDLKGLDKIVTLKTTNENIDSTLKQLFAGSEISYQKQENNIILLISKRPEGSNQGDKKKVTGVVKDEKGETVIGASVKVKGETLGTVTDIDGKFTLDVPQDATLIISYVGFTNKEIKIGDKTSLDIVIEEDAKLLNEVIVVGYGTMEKRQVTSSISTVRGDDLAQGIGGASVATALRGKVSGMSISGTSSPNSENTILLRGISSVNAGKGPLVVIDGIPGGDLRSLNQEDIESVNVLKDASAGAIYGTRAAGGVILVVTKKAKAGPIRVTYTGELSMETLRKRPKVLSASEYREFGLGGENGVYDYGSDTDWYDLLMRDNPLSHRHVINVNGGSDVANIYTTFTVQDQKGIAIGDGRKDYSGRINANFKMYDGKVEILTHAEYREAIRDLRRSNGMYNAAVKLNPTMDPYDPESTSGYNLKDFKGTDFNPLADVMLRQRDATDKWLLADATLKVNLTSDLSVQATIGYDSREWQATRFVSPHHRESDQGGYRGEAYHGFDKTRNLSFETYANYSKRLKDHTFSALAGYSFYEHNRELFNMTNKDFPVEGTGAWDMKSGTYLSDGKASMASSKDPRERLISVFARGNYSYKDKYMATASIRHEGSSKFGPDHRWGTFWAISGGWRISKEDFMKDVSFVNDLKLRIGYGVTGNESFSSPPGLTARVYGSNGMWLTDGEKWDSLYGSVRNVNRDLHWEETKGTNIGLDYSFLNNRLYGKIDYFWRNVNNLIFAVGVSQPPNVYPTTQKNIGTLKGRGWELEIGGIPVKTRDFEYNTTLRLSHQSSKITSIGNNTWIAVGDGFPAPGTPGNPYRLMDGMRVGQWYMKKHAGIDDNGKWLVYDKNNEIIPASKSSDDDKRFLGDAIPKLEVSWDHTFLYKNWDLSIYLRSWIDFDVFNMPDMYYGIPTNDKGVNFLRRAFDDDRKFISEEKQLSNYWLEDGTFLKIDAIVLGYNLNLKKYNKYIEKARFYLNMRDVACFTSYSGLDPEVAITGDSNGPLRPGLDNITGDAVFPKTRRFTLGVQLTF